MNKEEIKQVILDELQTKQGGITFAELNRRIPDRGTVSWLYPEGDNIIIWANMSDDYMDALAELMKEYKIQIKPCAPFIYACDGEMMDLPLATKPKKYKKPHWLPMTLEKGEKWESNK